MKRWCQRMCWLAVAPLISIIIILCLCFMSFLFTVALILVGYGNHLIHDWLQVAFLIHSHYDWLWQIIHYNRYQQPVLVHCTILWQGRDKMAPKCDVIMTTVACISYFREVTEEPSATKTLKITGRKKKKSSISETGELWCAGSEACWVALCDQ